MAKYSTVLRIVSFIVVFAMLYCIIPVSASDSIAYALEIGSVSVDMDKNDATDGYYNVSVPVNLTKNAGLVSITAEVTYDEAITLIGWTEGEIFPISEGNVSEYNISSALSTDLAKNPYKIMYVATTVATQFYSTGTLMTLNFKVPLSVRSLDYPISVKVTSLITQDDTQESKPASEVSELVSVVSGKISMTTEGTGIVPVALYEANSLSVGIDKGTNKFPTGSSEVINVSTKYAYQHLLPGDITKVIDAVRYELKVKNTTLKLDDVRYVKIGYRTNSTNNAPQVGVWINNGTKDIRVYDKAFATFENNDLWGETVYDLQQNYTGSSDSSIVLSGDASTDWNSLKDNLFKGICLRAYGSNNSAIASGSYFDIAYIALFASAEDAAKYTYFKSATVEFKDGENLLATKNLVVGDRLVYPAEPQIEGKVFAGWDTPAGTLLLGDTVVNAVFKEDTTYNVKISAENGSFTVDGGEALTSYDEEVGAGETIELLAKPETGYKFDGWYDVTDDNDTLLTENAEYSLFVKDATELEARFKDVNAPEEPVAVFDIYANKDTKKHIVNYTGKFTAAEYIQSENAFKFTGTGSQNAKDMGLSPDNVDFTDAGNTARRVLIESEADISYMVLTYRNPHGMTGITRRYIDNNMADIKEEIALKNSGDNYYSVIIDVSGQKLWFRDYYDRTNVSNIAFYPFSSLDSTDTNSYDLYLKAVALTKDLKDAYGYCADLVNSGDTAGYHLVGGDIITGEVKPEIKVDVNLDKHAYRMSVGGKLTLGVDTDEAATVTFESTNASVATVENGVITAVANGDAEILVTATNGDAVDTDKIKIFVTDISPITVEKVADAPAAPATKPVITFLGDSITAGSQTSKTYHSYLADRLYITAVNKGLSGSNIAGTGSSNQVSFIERVSQIPENTDLIFVMGGTNDFGQNAGTLARFVPGVRTLIEKLIEKAPDKPIVFSTPLQNGGYFSTTTNKAGETLAQYVAEIEKACAEYNIPVIKAYRNEAFKDFCTWDGDTVTGYNSTYYADGVHPNAEGHRVMADFFESELEKAGVVNYVKYTTTKVTAIGGGTVAVGGGEVAESISATVVTGTNITLTATANAGYKLEGWYDITNGKNVLLSRETSFVYTANKDAKIEARFMDETISIAVKLVASTSEGGFISVNGNTEEDVNDYVNGSSTQELTAVPEEGYVFAYWKRVSCQSGTEIFMSADATLNAAPLGNAVYYMPVFVSEGTTLNLYLDAQELILGTEEPEIPSRLGYTGTGWNQVSEGEIVNVFKPVYVRADATTVLTIVYANAEPVEIAFKYDDQISIIGTLDNPIWTLTANGEETIISFDKKFTFGAAFTSNITLTETANDNGATANVNGVEAVYDSGAKLIKFVAMFTLPKEAILNERGILLTNDADVADDMELNTPNIIVGRVNSAPDAATKTFIINKTKVNAGDTWYGRPYIVYTENGETKTLYAKTMTGKAE